MNVSLELRRQQKQIKEDQASAIEIEAIKWLSSSLEVVEYLERTTDDAGQDLAAVIAAFYKANQFVSMEYMNTETLEQQIGHFFLKSMIELMKEDVEDKLYG